MFFDENLSLLSTVFKSLFSALFCLIIFANVAAQEPLPAGDGGTSSVDAGAEMTKKDISWRFQRGTREIGYEIGFAPTQPTFFGNKEYDTAGRKLTLASIRFGQFLGTRSGVTYQYLFEVIPVSFALKNEVLENANNRRTKSTYGFGAQPLGFRFLFRPNNRVKPFLQAGVGVVFSKDPIPVPEGTRINFSGEFGGGVMYRLSESRSVNIGYRYFHISNMHLSKANPGYNDNIFYFGYSFFKK